MKRAIYEWGWMLSAAVAASLLVLWAVSTFSSFTIDPFDLDGETYIAISDGTFFCSSMDRDHTTPHFFDPNLARMYPNNVDGYEELNAGKFNLNAPGFRYRSEKDWGELYFAVEASLLIPACLVGIVSLAFGALLWRYRRRVWPALKASP